MRACSRVDPHTCRLGAHAPGPTCAHCCAPDVIRGDGAMALVCPRCVRALGRIAGDPSSADEAVLDRLEAEAYDVVTLVSDVRGTWTWRWTALWPGAGDATRIRGRHH